MEFNEDLDIKQMASTSLIPKRSIAKGRTILWICGRSFTWVGFNAIKRITLTGTHFAENTEEADSEETLEFDEAKYPKLPDGMLKLCLHRRKAILRQFMAAVRRKCYC